MLSALLALTLAATATATPAANPILLKRAPQPGVILTQCAKPGVLALAYDDGPYDLTSELVDILDAAGAKATFFWTGTLYGCIYSRAEAVKKAFESGHQIASHTWYAIAIPEILAKGLREAHKVGESERRRKRWRF